MAPSARQRYVNDSTRTASPARLLTMLYDGLLSDLRLADSALSERDLFTASERLVRAQAIVLELRRSLKPELWSGGAELSKIYTYVHSLLLSGNITKDPAKVRDCIRLIEPLHEAWHGAAEKVQSGELAAAGPSR
jgi:flagellar secretion chaperone FliS